MNFVYRRAYCGPLQLAVFDWAGTTVDYGCIAPAAVFVEGFRRQGVTVSMAQARGPMGMEKRAHIATLAALPDVAGQWQAVHGRAITAADIDALYADFVPALLAVLDRHSDLIPGTLAAVEALRGQGVRIAASTGYFAEAMQVVARAAAGQGYTPEVSIAATEVPAGRPAPWMIYRAMEKLGIYPPAAVVAVGDTVPDVEAGLNAGVWTIGLTQTGNEVGLTAAEFAVLPPSEQAARVDRAADRLTAAGAHLVVEGIWEAPAAVAAINARLARGEAP